MGPIALFDKSFLQGLSLDESVWFSHFFTANICPVFYVETLADLEKSVRAGRTPEQEVGIIADKCPEMGAPNAEHSHICLAELLGHFVPATGQMLVAGGRRIKEGDKTSIIYDYFPESQAFQRWQRRDFLNVEREYARVWRESLARLDLAEVASLFKGLGVDGKTCKTLAEAKAMAHGIVAGGQEPHKTMRLAFLFLGVPNQHHRDILERWCRFGYPPLTQYAPYVAHVLTVELFFQIALAADLISSERASNRVDIAYLFYLPFCMMFVSSDKLHQRCAPLFLRPNQRFIWGPDLKASLTAINQFYSTLDEGTKEKGLFSFAANPPAGDFLVTQLWRDLLRPTAEPFVPTLSPEAEKKIVEYVRRIKGASVAAPEATPNPDHTREPDELVIERSVSLKKGSWFQLPKDIPRKLGEK